MTRVPRNTRKDNPMGMLAEAMVFGASESIARQEAQGQRELVQSDVLPTRGIESMREVIESNGGSIGGPISGDDIFTEVVLPAGWKKASTDHSMWSDLLDANGHKRAGIFYKAAFYDRSAHVSPNCRFTLDCYELSTDEVVQCLVKDVKGEVDFKTNPLPAAGRRIWDVQDEAVKQAEAFLNEHWPDWKSPCAYW